MATNNVDRLIATGTLHQLTTQLDALAAELSKANNAFGYDVVLLRRYNNARDEMLNVLTEMNARRD